MNLSKSDILLLAHALATTFMGGLIWFVQIVHYPLLLRVGSAGFVEYERLNMRRTTWIVAPLMWVELGTAIWLVFYLSSTADAWVAVVGMVLLAIIWGSTAVLQVPCHRRLLRGFDIPTVHRLERTSWIRTIAWSARSVLAVGLLLQYGLL